MKNFKRVISAVIALALSASTLVAVSAAKFTDVDDTNSYAKAIESLAALDVVSGYEDGSFNPDGDITRAEAARMIVSALNMNADAAASAGDTQFADVNESASWAKGFVNVGVAQGYIHGYNESSFGPQDKVTFAQMCVMLTTITGYGDYAAANGGYPQGYMAMAATAGINKGVALAAETPLKRGQVAQMVYNGVTAPMLDITTYKFDGNEYGKMDGSKGTKGSCKTLLSDRFDAVELRAVVDDVKNGKVTFSTASEILSDYAFIANQSEFFTVNGNGKITNITGNGDIVVENDIDLSTSVKQQIKAIIVNDSNNKKHLIYAEGTDAVTTKEFEATGAGSYTVGGAAGTNSIKFDTTKETFENKIDVYLNGVEFGDDYVIGTDDAKIKAVLNNAVGTIKLVKVPNGSGAAPSNYNTIVVEGYEIAQVRGVEYLSGKTTVTFALCGKNNITSKFPTGAPKAFDTIEIADNDVVSGAVKLSVTLGGEAIELKDLKKNDIIAIKTRMQDTVNTNKIDASNKDITVLVSRETVAGKVTAVEVDDNNNKFTIDGTDYASVDKARVKPEIATVYNLVYLDPFGRIAAVNEEEVEETKNYAILAKVDDGYATLVLADGSTKTYEVKNNDVYPAAPKVSSVTISDVSNVLTSTEPANCVISYKLKNGKIDAIDKENAGAFSDGTSIATADRGEYRADILRLGGIGINSSTNLINVDYSSYKKYTGVSVAQLVDGEKYIAIGYGKAKNANVYALVLLKKAGYNYNSESRFAVADSTEWSAGLDAEGDTVNQLKVVANGEKKALDFANKVSIDGATATTITTGTTALARGTAFFYTLDDDGRVDEIRTITTAEIATKDGVLLSNAFGAPGTDYDGDNTKWGTYATAGDANDVKLSKPSYRGTENNRLIQGVVVKVGTNSVGLVDMPDNDKPLDIAKCETFILADDCKIYTFNDKTDVETKDKVSANGTLIESDFDDWKITTAPDGNNSNYVNNSQGSIVWLNATTKVPNVDATAQTWAAARGIKADDILTLKDKTSESKTNYAIALVIDSKVVEIYEVIHK